jgi:hypothetical protein
VQLPPAYAFFPAQIVAQVSCVLCGALYHLGGTGTAWDSDEEELDPDFDPDDDEQMNHLLDASSMNRVVFQHRRHHPRGYPRRGGGGVSQHWNPGLHNHMARQLAGYNRQQQVGESYEELLALDDSIKKKGHVSRPVIAVADHNPKHSMIGLSPFSSCISHLSATIVAVSSFV